MHLEILRKTHDNSLACCIDYFVLRRTKFGRRASGGDGVWRENTSPLERHCLFGVWMTLIPGGVVYKR